MKKTLIYYHGHCPDGFGGAYAAWKKFGDGAEYIGLKHGKEPVVIEPGHDLYFIDFCYPKEIMDEYAAGAASLTILDHHLGTSEAVKSFPGGHFDNDHSGAVIAWQHFHPGEPVPTLLSYIEDGDLYRHALPDSRALLAYIHTKPLSFSDWDALVAELESAEGFSRAREIGTTYREHYGILASQIADAAELVSFEGYECYLASSSSAFISDVGNALARKKGPIALVAQVRPDGIRVGIRGDGTVDVAEIARRFGGNGHYSAAGFSLPFSSAMPWSPLIDAPHSN